MLIRLFVENVALAERIEVEPGPGLTVLTGETGAGKSLLVDALGLLQRGRGAVEFIRTGSDTAAVEATFRSGDPTVSDALARSGVLADGEVVVRRLLNRDGRHKFFLNGAQVPAGVAASVTERLLDIHGQHEQQSLLSASTHLDLLDEAAGLTERVAAYASRYAAWQGDCEQRDTLAAAVMERERRLDFLRYQLDEIDKVAPQPGEWDTLEAEARRLANAERLTQVCGEGDELLYSGDHAAASRLRTLAKRLDEAARFDERFAAWASDAAEIAVRAEELARSLADYQSRNEADPRRLEAINERLDELAHLKRKYGALAGLSDEAAALRRERDELENSDSRLAALQAACDKGAAELHVTAAELSQERRAAAGAFARRIEQAVRPLGMGEAVIDWRFAAEDALGPKGLDGVELLLSANRGEPPKPLAKVASGGELSRVMLALHTVALQSGGPGCIIFDEIDAGIGGDVGNAVGAALRAVAEARQVICVTHLPQIAAHAQDHWAVTKRVVDERTVSELRRLCDDERLEEIGRMLGGNVDQVSRRHARALLERASP